MNDFAKGYSGGYAENAVRRFWRTLENSIIELKKTKVINNKTTVKELSQIIKKNIEEKTNVFDKRQ